MGFDIDRARRDTPGVRQVVHLNNAGSALPPVQVTEAMIAHLRLEAERGGYEAAASTATKTQQTYAAVARLLNCDVEEVAVVDSATRAWNLGFHSFVFEPGDRILTGRAEYASNVIALQQAARRAGAVIEVVDDDECGQLCVADLERRLNRRERASGHVRLIALTHVASATGLVNPVERVGDLARAAGIPFLLDACQSVGQLPVDVQRIGCDLLSATGRKFLRGPRGTGFLYVRRSILDNLVPPFVDMHAAHWTPPNHIQLRSDARRFEHWECNHAARIGLGVAVDYALSWGLDAIEARVTALAEGLRGRLNQLGAVRVHDSGLRRCGIVSFTVEGRDAADIQRCLAQHNINIGVSPRGNPGLSPPHARDLARASVHYYNTEDELEQLAAALRPAVL